MTRAQKRHNVKQLDKLKIGLGVAIALVTVFSTLYFNQRATLQATRQGLYDETLRRVEAEKIVESLYIQARDQ